MAEFIDLQQHAQGSFPAILNLLDISDKARPFISFFGKPGVRPIPGNRIVMLAGHFTHALILAFCIRRPVEAKIGEASEAARNQMLRGHPACGV